MKKILREPLFYLLPLLIVAYLATISANTKISDVKLIKEDKVEDIKLPFSSTDIQKNETFTISFNLLVKNKIANIKIHPDDCIQEIFINGKKFPLDKFNNLCDLGNGVNFDFSKYVSKGLNHFEIRITNSYGGPGGIGISKSFDGFKGLSLVHYIFVLIFLFSAALILKKLKFKFIPLFIILLGIVVRLILYSYTGPMQNTYDVYGHLDHIRIISDEKRLPRGNECWECYQPPLYYIIFAPVKNIADRYDSSLTNRILQQGNLLISFAAIILGVALIINLFGNNWPAYLAALFSVLWPGFVLSASRINNDILFYFGSLFCMFFAQRYWRMHKNLDIFLASIGAAIALAAKSNGLVILGAWIIIYILSTVSFFKTGSLRTLLASIFIVILSFSLSNYKMIANIFERKEVKLVSNIGGLPNGLKVKNTAGNYLYFDLQDYLLEPYVDPFKDEGGRQYFWNYAIKTSLFGDFKLWNTDIGRILATMLNALALIIFLLALWGMLHVKFKEFPPLLFAVFLFAALICYRVIHPYSCNNDFRFIFPALFPLAYFSMRGAQILENSRLRKLSYASMLAFAACSLVFIVGMAL